MSIYDPEQEIEGTSDGTPQTPEESPEPEAESSVPSPEEQEGGESVAERRVDAAENVIPIAQEVAQEMGLALRIEPSETSEPPYVNLVFEGTERQQEEFVEKIGELREERDI